jgi:hypothetical protein
MDLVIFEKELAKALNRPDEWVICRADSEWLLHRDSGIQVYASGGTYPKGATASPYNQICTAPQNAVTGCWKAVSLREIEARHKNAIRDRTAFLNDFHGFKS